MYISVINNYPSILDEVQQRAYISVLLQVADIDGISDNELGLVKEMAKISSIDQELFDSCLLNFKSYDLSALPDYNKKWAICLIRDAVIIANIDSGISQEELNYLQKIAEIGGIDSDEFKSISDLTLNQIEISETWSSLLAN